MRELLVALTEGDIEAATLNGHEPRSATALEKRGLVRWLKGKKSWQITAKGKKVLAG